MDELIYKSTSFLADAIRSKKVAAVDVVEAHLHRIEVVNPTLNAVVQIVHNRARAEAKAADQALACGEVRGPLHGVPITIKDSFDTKGIISTWGTQGRKSFIPEQDATVVARLRRAGAIVLGKTNTPELTVGGEMENVIYGATFNPYDLSKSPGGSSGGAGAIIAAGGSSLDLGSDTGGSIREPAHMCGIAGIKPTFGRVPRTGHAVSFGSGLIDTLTHIGPMARYVEDLRLSLPLICGPDWQDPTVVPMVMGDPAAVRIRDLRIALYTDGGLSAPESAISETVLAAGKALAEAGAAVEEQAPEVLNRTPELYQWLHFVDRGAWVRRLLHRAGTLAPGPHLARLLEEVETAYVPDLSTVLDEVNHFRSKMLQFISRFDAVICPVETYPAVPHGVTEEPDKHDGWGHLYAYNLTGWPAAVVRGGTTPQGLPIGVQVVGRPWREDVVLALLQTIETTFGGYQPPKTYP